MRLRHQRSRPQLARSTEASARSWRRVGAVLPLAAILLALAWLALAGAGAAQGNVYQVNSTADTDDGVCNATNCTLREAIRLANNHPGPDTITFNLPGSPPYVIEPAAPLPAISGPLLLDGLSQPGVQIGGAKCDATPCHGLYITGDQVTVQGLAIGGFAEGYGIYLHGADSCIVRGNVIGAGAAGGNWRGIRIEDGTENRIGGTGAPDRNVISGNLAEGIVIMGAATANRVQGNFIGVTTDGTAALGNGGAGILIGASGNTIGGSEAGAGNVISGNGAQGVWITAAGSENTVAGNTIGLNAAGTVALGNGPLHDGVLVAGPDNVIGGAAAGARNVISGNAACGVWLTGGKASGNRVEGNFIGPGPAGSGGVPGNKECGILVDGASGNAIGGDAAGAGNVISGNAQDGILIEGPAATDNMVQGNLIGVAPNGMSALGNGRLGVLIALQASGNTIGGPTPGARNVISGNGGPGVGLTEMASGNLIQGNDIGLNAAGAPALGNTGPGVAVVSGEGNRILANRIGGNQGLGIDLGSDGVTPNDTGDGDVGPNRLQNFPVLTRAVTTGVSCTIEGTLNSQPGRTYRIEFFASAACDPSGYGEGAIFLGATEATTDGAGNAAFSAHTPLGAPPGSVITLTATDGEGNTSEFSRCISSTFQTPTPTLTGTATPTPTATGTATETPTSTPTPSASPTASPSPTEPLTATPSASTTVTATPSPSGTTSPSPSVSPTDAPTSTATATSQVTPTGTATASPVVRRVYLPLVLWSGD